MELAPSNALVTSSSKGKKKVGTIKLLNCRRAQSRRNQLAYL